MNFIAVNREELEVDLHGWVVCCHRKANAVDNRDYFRAFRFAVETVPEAGWGNVGCRPGPGRVDSNKPYRTEETKRMK
jgi:hypothetical protein